MKLLDASELEAGYGDVQILKSVSLHVDCGEIVAIFGSNGSGKSTLLRTIVGLVPLWGGYIRFEGKHIENLSVDERVRLGISLAAEGRRLFLGMSVEENLLLGSWTDKGNVKENLDKVYTYLPELYEKRGYLAGDLSGGQQQMLSIGRALMSNTKLLMIDELSLGLAPSLVDRLAAKLLEIRDREKISMLIVEQEVSLALDVSDRAYVFDLGEVVDQGTSLELKERDSIRRTYLI